MGTNAVPERVEFDGIELIFDGPLASLVLNDPDRLNAISPAMAGALADGLVELSKPRRGVRAVLLTGAGRSFCAGANLTGEAAAISKGERPRSALTALESAYHPALRRLRDLPMPVIAAVNGPCVGIGIGMALAADYLVAARSAFFLVPFTKLASAPDSALTWSLPRLIGIQRARRMILRAERVPAPTALEWGMVCEVLPDDGFVDASRAIAREFAEGPTAALSEMKRLIADGDMMGMDAAMEAEARAVARTSRTKDNIAAMRVFGTKDKPQFTGQ